MAARRSPSPHPARRRPGRAAAMAQRAGKPSVPSAPSTDVVPITATGRGRGGQAGEVLDSDSLSRLIADTLGSMPRNGAPQGEVVLARADWRDRYTPERKLGQDAFSNGLKLAKIADARDLQAALTASGGICAPVNIDWSVPVFAVADTPLADELPSFQADRGGLTFTAASRHRRSRRCHVGMDRGDGRGRSGQRRHEAGPLGRVRLADTVYVDAVPSRLGFGNMQGRFAPEWTAANMELTVAQASRIRELNLLSHIDARLDAGQQFQPAGHRSRFARHHRPGRRGTTKMSTACPTT